MTTDLSVGDRVFLVVPENERLHGMSCRVLEMTEWGATVSTSVGTGQFRAAWEEMSKEPSKPHSSLKRGPARDQGYTGDVCQTCGSLRMRRNGSCLLCEDCGSTSGCS
jgi:ribonucleoside-diphosphate reductase alpha chain